MTYHIWSKYVDYLLVPANGIEGSFSDEYETSDGVLCELKNHTVWNNEGGRYDDELNDICLWRYKCEFSTIRSLWISRLGSVDKYWFLVKMVKK